MEERGQIQAYQSHSFCILFETAPIWILALRPNICRWIYLPTCNSLEHLISIISQHKIDKTLYLLLIRYLGNHRLRFSAPTQDVIYLVSGTIPFLNDKSFEIGQKKGIFITDHHLHLRRACDNSPLQLTRFKHTSFGGATNFEGVYGYNFPIDKPKQSSFRRKLGDYMDYSIPPTSISTNEMTLSYQKIVPVQYLHRLVHYPTHFSATGFGYRCLCNHELASLFGLDIHLQPHDVKSLNVKTFSFVPIQILDQLLVPLMAVTSNPIDVTQDLPLPPIYKDPGYTLIPQISKHLPNTFFCNWFWL